MAEKFETKTEADKERIVGTERSDKEIEKMPEIKPEEDIEKLAEIRAEIAQMQPEIEKAKETKSLSEPLKEWEEKIKKEHKSLKEKFREYYWKRNFKKEKIENQDRLWAFIRYLEGNIAKFKFERVLIDNLLTMINQPNDPVLVIENLKKIGFLIEDHNLKNDWQELSDILAQKEILDEQCLQPINDLLGKTHHIVKLKDIEKLKVISQDSDLMEIVSYAEKQFGPTQLEMSTVLFDKLIELKGEFAFQVAELIRNKVDLEEIHLDKILGFGEPAKLHDYDRIRILFADLQRQIEKKLKQEEREKIFKEEREKSREDEKILAEGEILDCEKLGGGANGSYISRFKDIKGVYKPTKEEKAGLRSCITAGTYANREVSAFIVDKALDFHLVSPTVLREKGLEKYSGGGSVQKFIEDAKVSFQVNYYDLMPDARDTFRDDLKKLAVLDIIVYNTDRHTGNYLINKDTGRVWAIDNGLCFPPTGHPKTFESVPVRSFRDQEIPEALIKKMENFINQFEAKADLKRQLIPYLKQDQIEAILIRIEDLIRDKKIIEPRI